MGKFIPSLPDIVTNSPVQAKESFRSVKLRVVIDIPEKVLLAEKTDAESFGHELRKLASVKV
jgi:hypothetical protein